jgi:pyridinium-3,5-bisthiocarboxylic acid mononucleotide nickel chelatase
MRRVRTPVVAEASAWDGEGPASTVAWFHCFAGIAGDMALGSLLDAGAELDEVMTLLRRLPLRGWDLRPDPVLRAGVAATHAVVEVAPDVVVRTHAHIVGLIEEARLPARVSQRALAAFGALARVEGELHRRPTAQVHFHEVGSHDTIVDIVGTAAALEVLGVDEVTASAVATGTGTVRTAHGFLPNPSPAVVRLLHGVPSWGRDLAVELTTPTGAAILTSVASAYGPLPPMVVSSSGFGAGSAEIDGLPNCTQVVVGESAASKLPGQPLVLLEANLDDATGETLAHAVESLLEVGALDAWITPVVMKKGRPGHVVSALVDAALVESVRQTLRAETGTLGVRATAQERWPASRTMDAVGVEGVAVRVKVSPGRVKVEHADAARVAARTGLPLREVVVRAETAWRRRVDAELDETTTRPLRPSDSGYGGGDRPPDGLTPA